MRGLQAVQYGSLSFMNKHSLFIAGGSLLHIRGLLSQNVSETQSRDIPLDN